MDRTDVDILFDFDAGVSAEGWRPVNDTVMGGISRSTFEVLPDGYGRFAGTVSLENNGGFASVRTFVGDHDFTPYRGLKLRVKGDGKTYTLRLRVDMQFDGVSFRSAFDTNKDSWQEIEVPFEAFIPTYRGRVLRNVGAIQPQAITQLGFLVSDKQTGPFELLIDWIGCYS